MSAVAGTANQSAVVGAAASSCLMATSAAHSSATSTIRTSNPCSRAKELSRLTG